MRSEQSSFHKFTVQNLSSLISWWEEDENKVFKQYSHCLSTISKNKDPQSHLYEAETLLLDHVKARVGEARFSKMRLVRLSDNASGEFKERL